MRISKRKGAVKCRHVCHCGDQSSPSGAKNISMAGKLRFQVLGADKFDHSVAAIAQRSAELAIVIGLWWRSVSGPIQSTRTTTS
jgi:hypothetical protein